MEVEPNLNAAQDAPSAEASLPIQVNFGPAWKAQYITSKFNQDVDFVIKVSVESKWEPYNEGSHWLQLVVWVAGVLHYFSGEVGIGENDSKTIELPSDKILRLKAPAGTQHVIDVQHDNKGAKAISMKITGEVTI